jgi:hypothetical protein
MCNSASSKADVFFSNEAELLVVLAKETSCAYQTRTDSDCADSVDAARARAALLQQQECAGVLRQQEALKLRQRQLKSGLIQIHSTKLDMVYDAAMEATFFDTGW